MASLLFVHLQVNNLFNLCMNQQSLVSEKPVVSYQERGYKLPYEITF